MASTRQLQYRVSGNNQFGCINLASPTAAAAFKNAKELLERGYTLYRTCTIDLITNLRTRYDLDAPRLAEPDDIF
jgi:hypothetical protein